MKSYKFKVCLLGDKGVGKTSLIRRFVHNEFDDFYLPTIGTSVEKKVVPTEDGEASLMVWDILGEEGFDTLRAMYFRGAAGGIFVCDCTDKETVWNIEKWIESLRKVSGKTAVCIFVNKWDLANREVSEADLAPFIQRYGATLLTTSAKTGENVETGFEAIVAQMMANM